MLEHKRQPLLPTHLFIGRIAKSFALSGSIVFIALAAGILGYHGIAQLSFVDSLLNATMILTGMGPVSPMNTSAAKIFASCYALFSGVIFLSAIGIVLAPIFHRIMHIVHLDETIE
jgi:hypothetical protein